MNCTRSEPATLLVGGMRVDQAAAREFARRYLDPATGWAYPAYYDHERARGPLVDTDFLAPVLLNVRMGIPTYRNLLAVRDELQHKLDRLPERGLLEATADDIAKIADLYTVVDDGRTTGAQATTLSKVLHRKRPDLIPLYDDQVGTTYKRSPEAPVARGDASRPWKEMMRLFVPAVRDDLLAQQDFHEEIASFAAVPVVTPLRALDIIAWWAGGPDVVLAD